MYAESRLYKVSGEGEGQTREKLKNKHNRSDKDNTKREICKYF